VGIGSAFSWLPSFRIGLQLIDGDDFNPYLQSWNSAVYYSPRHYEASQLLLKQETKGHTFSDNLGLWNPLLAIAAFQVLSNIRI
jgi:hypothetical protein